MAIRFFEKPAHVDSSGSEFGQTPERDLHYQCVGTIHESIVRVTALSATSAVIFTPFGMLYRGEPRIKQTHYNQWDVDINYNPRNRSNGEWTWDFDTTGGTVHITNSKETIAKYATAGLTAPEYEGAIDVQGDEVKGTEIVIPAMRLSVEYSHPAGVITMAYAMLLHDLTGTVNATPMFGRPPGEVLFLGARGSDGTLADAKVGYQFALSKNRLNFSVGAITGVDKLGWHSAWIAYAPATKTAGGLNYSVKVPKFVYVERVYDTADLAGVLGFGA